MSKTNQEWIDANQLFLGLHPYDLMALCVYGEARGECDEGKIAVINVIRNRMRRFGRYSSRAIMRCGIGKEFHSVILKKWQFSCFNPGDVNRQKLINLARDLPTSMRTDKTLNHIRSLVDQFHTIKDNTGGATLYHEESIRPAWTLSEKVLLTAKVGHHWFYAED